MRGPPNRLAGRQGHVAQHLGGDVAARRAGQDPGRQVVRGEASAGGCQVAHRVEGLIGNRTPASITQGLVVESVQVMTLCRRPSLASTSAPLHCAVTSWQVRSKHSSLMIAGAATISRVRFSDGNRHMSDPWGSFGRCVSSASTPAAAYVATA